MDGGEDAAVKSARPARRGVTSIVDTVRMRRLYRPCVVLPTYNEAENLPLLVAALRALGNGP